MVMSLLRLDMRAPAFSPAKREDLYAAALDMATWADDQGFDAVVLSEHHGTEDGYLPSPLTLAAVVAGRTRRIDISIAALLLPLYDPVKLAEDMAVLDHASGGRVKVTLGLGYRPEEYAQFGIDWKTRGQRLDECLDVLLRAWRGGTLPVAGAADPRHPAAGEPAPPADPDRRAGTQCGPAGGAPRPALSSPAPVPPRSSSSTSPSARSTGSSPCCGRRAWAR